MAKQSDRSALLDWEEVAAVEEPSLATEVNEKCPRATTVSSRALGSTVPGTGWSSGPGETAPGELTSSDTGVLTDKVASLWVLPNDVDKLQGRQYMAKRRDVEWNRRQQDQVIAVFVVTFDTRSGNMLEWCLPQDFNLDGVEFKSMASGSHRIASDFVYFRKDSYFGLACFANLPVESELERGARMKSVGILSPSYTTLYHHMAFLENQVRDQLRCPGQYSALEAFFEQRKGLLPARTTWNNMVAAVSTPKHFMSPEIKVSHPAGCVSQFVQFFGEQVMVLWKFALLRRRILIFSPPPVGVVCYRVYSCLALARVPLPGVGKGLPPFRPFFYVNVTDIHTLETELSYVACTTERIFEEKKHLFDVYVDNQTVQTHRESLQPLLRLTGSDREKYNKFQEKRKRLVGDSSYTEEELFILFFSELNTKIFQTLLEVASSVDRALTEQHMQRMGLDPKADHKFLVDILETYGIDVMLMIDTSCCF
ncbi:DENN domain-containing protein 11-like [Clupea harengus]|uniref:DENN domain-containing protein 11 n=1 Tax=Clupea harengus TaxID=7950 RepID=A0A8M1KG14_CLUHA|nr:DENN domain-containing protein 11-like [Clupea harengus]